MKPARHNESPKNNLVPPGNNVAVASDMFALYASFWNVGLEERVGFPLKDKTEQSGNAQAIYRHAITYIGP